MSCTRTRHYVVNSVSRHAPLVRTLRDLTFFSHRLLMTAAGGAGQYVLSVTGRRRRRRIACQRNIISGDLLSEQHGRTIKRHRVSEAPGGLNTARAARRPTPRHERLRRCCEGLLLAAGHPRANPGTHRAERGGKGGGGPGTTCCFNGR